MNGLDISVFPQPQDVLHEIWFQLAEWLLRFLKLPYYESPESKVKQWP